MTVGNGNELGHERIRGNQIDCSSALAALGGNQELLQELGTIFCEDAPRILDELDQALLAGDPTTARRATHSLKGLAATFFARPTMEIALRLEREAAAGRLTAFDNGGLQQLKKAISDLVFELEDRGLVTGFQ